MQRPRRPAATTPGPCHPNPAKTVVSAFTTPRGDDSQGRPTTTYTCSCSAGFSGAECSSGHPEQPWCRVELPSLPETLQSWIDTGNWIQGATIANFYLAQLAEVDWAVSMPEPRCEFHGSRNITVEAQMDTCTGGEEAYEAMDSFLNRGVAYEYTACAGERDECAVKAEVGMPCAWRYSEAKCIQRASEGYYRSFSESDCRAQGAGLSDFTRQDMYGCVQTAPLPPYDCARQIDCDNYCFGTPAVDPKVIPTEAVHLWQAFAAGSAEAFRVFAAALPPSSFPNGLPTTTMLDFENGFGALCRGLAGRCRAVGCVLACLLGVGPTAALSTLMGEEVCAASYDLDDFQLIVMVLSQLDLSRSVTV